MVAKLYAESDKRNKKNVKLPLLSIPEEPYPTVVQFNDYFCAGDW